MNMHNYLSHRTPPSKTSCRQQNVWSNTNAGGETAKDARRRRHELRRIRPAVSQPKSDADLESSSSSDSDVCLKKKRDQIAIEGTSSDLENGGSRNCRPYGKISVVGRRREMEDVVAVELGFLKRGDESYDFFGVFDGHGGWRVAQACGQVLHKTLAKIVEEEGSQEVDWEAVMAAGFRMMDEEVNKNAEAVVAVVGENEAVVANCGGTRAVVSSGGVVVQLEDHKPAKCEEVEGVEDTIALEPKVRVMRRSHGDEFLILGSHGLWDVISDEFACQVTRRLCDGAGKRSGEGGAAVAAAALIAELAVARGSKDNISIIVVDLKD